jgi:hypothetical protein
MTNQNNCTAATTTMKGPEGSASPASRAAPPMTSMAARNRANCLWKVIKSLTLASYHRNVRYPRVADIAGLSQECSMPGVVRTSLIAAAAALATSACATNAVQRDLTAEHEPRVGRLCEVTVGMSGTAIPQGRVVVRYPEGIEEERLVVPLCGGTVEAELAFDDAGHVAFIIVSASGACLHGLCVGDRYGEASRNPHVQPFSTEEEGGMVSLMRPDLGIGYSFDLGRLPTECLEGPEPCSRVDALRLDALIVGRPATDS